MVAKKNAATSARSCNTEGLESPVGELVAMYFPTFSASHFMQKLLTKQTEKLKFREDHNQFCGNKRVHPHKQFQTYPKLLDISELKRSGLRRDNVQESPVLSEATALFSFYVHCQCPAQPRHTVCVPANSMKPAHTILSLWSEAFSPS